MRRRKGSRKDAMEELKDLGLGRMYWSINTGPNAFFFLSDFSTARFIHRFIHYSIIQRLEMAERETVLQNDYTDVDLHVFCHCQEVNAVLRALQTLDCLEMAQWR